MSVIYPPHPERIAGPDRGLVTRPWALFFQQVIEKLQNLEQRIETIEGWVEVQAWDAVITATTTSPTGYTRNYGQFVRLGDTVIGRVAFTMDVGVTAGSGTWIVSLPATVPAGSGAQRNIVGFGSIVQGPGTAYYPLVVRLSAATGLVMIPDDGGSTPVTDAAPVAWAAGDQLGLTVIYQLTP